LLPTKRVARAPSTEPGRPFFEASDSRLVGSLGWREFRPDRNAVPSNRHKPSNGHDDGMRMMRTEASADESHRAKGKLTLGFFHFVEARLD
jgi:hypothetical protein